MWKVMIADDEPKIRRGLRAMIERMMLPILIVCEADDGQTALEAAEAIRPHILLVDINMPFLNGLEFIERLGRKNREARIIVVTGYEEFEYAHNALSLGVQAYLLKPVEAEELHGALASAIAELEETAARNRHYDWALGQLARRREYLLEQFLCEVIDGQWTEAEIAEHFAYFQIPPMRDLVLLLITVTPSELNAEPLDHLTRQLAFADVLRGTASQCRATQLFYDERGNVLMLCDADPSQILQLEEAAHQAVAGELGVRATVAATQVERLSALGDAYDRLMEEILRQHGRSNAVQSAMTYIERHLNQTDLCLDEVANDAGINPTYLSRLMKQELGMPFAKYLTCARINRAVKLMRSSEIKIKDAAERVGYATPHYFSAAFKKLLGVSPAEYRSVEKAK